MRRSQILLLISSLLLSSSLSLIFSPILSKNLPFQLFSKDIPSVTDQLIQSKTFDLLDFALTILFSLVLFFGNYLLAKKYLKKESSAAYLFLLLASVFIFLQTHFVTFSKTHALLLIAGAEAIFIFLHFFGVTLNNLKSLSKERLFLILANGAFLGFYFLLINNALTQLPLLSLFLLFISPLALIALTKYHNNFTQFPGIFLLFSIFFPTKLLFLIILGVMSLSFYFIIFKFKPHLLFSTLSLNLFYPVGLIFLFTFNPNFFIGNFDSVEEGFFLGWVERLKQGQVLYKDVAAYHPPFLIWGMYLFSKLIGFSVYSERLFLHLLQILGVIIYFYFLKKLTKNIWFSILGLILFLSIASTLVRNNVEIRVGLGLLSLLFLLNFYQTKRVFWLIFSGLMSAISLFVSIEVGLVTLATVLIALNFTSLKQISSLMHLKINGFYLLGFLIVAVPVFSYLFITNALFPFFEQISFYTQAFSKGYFNLEIDRSISLSFFHWHIFDQYLTSIAMLWEVSKLILIGGLVFSTFKLFTRNFDLNNRYIFITSLFGLLLFRTALGRSDQYHLLFVLAVSFTILSFLLAKLYKINPAWGAVLAFGLMFYFLRPQFNSVFLEGQIFKFETYGKILEQYNKYNFPASQGLLIGKEIKPDDLNALVQTIQQKTSSNDSIFVYPWMPELYFYTRRKNATSFDTPYAFFTDFYQQQMIADLKQNNPKFIIYNPEMSFGNLAPNSLPKVNKYLLDNYKEVQIFGPNRVLEKN